jgi:hypothetical protein
MVANLALYQNSPEATYSLRSEIPQEWSYTLKIFRPTLPDVDELVQRVVERIGAISDVRMKYEASEIVKEFRLAAIEAGAELANAPALEILDADDGSVLIEWQFKDRRLGFNIEPVQGHSGWYYAFSRNSGGQCGSGTLQSLDMRMLIRLILNSLR